MKTFDAISAPLTDTVSDVGLRERASASFNDKMLGHGEPVRFLAPAERADVIVQMNQPGVWILGAIKDEDRKIGLGVVIEYATERGEPQWAAPPSSVWDYTIFGDSRPLAAPITASNSPSRKCLAGPGGYNRWTLNGRSWPAANPLFTTEPGKRYRIAMINSSGDNRPVHLHHHTFEVTKVGDKATAGVMKDTINMTRFSSVEIDFTADDPGLTLFHCHHQDHQDEASWGL